MATYYRKVSGEEATKYKKAGLLYYDLAPFDVVHVGKGKWIRDPNRDTGLLGYPALAEPDRSFDAGYKFFVLVEE